MSQTKSIQIEFELFKAMMEYVDRHPDLSDPDYDRIQHGVQAKLKTMLRRRLYTLYKAAPSEKTRALAREAYLNELGVPHSFRWPDCQDANITRCDLMGSIR